MNEYSISTQPKYVGAYYVGGARGLRIVLENKPKWLHRKMMLWCFGWEWKEMK